MIATGCLFRVLEGGNFMVSSLHGLVMRSKEGLVLPHEIESIAVELRDGPPDRDVYRMIYILGRSGAKKWACPTKDQR